MRRSAVGCQARSSPSTPHMPDNSGEIFLGEVEIDGKTDANVDVECPACGTNSSSCPRSSTVEAQAKRRSARRDALSR